LEKLKRRKIEREREREELERERVNRPLNSNFSSFLFLFYGFIQKGVSSATKRG
jgi:hypothetical protein